jgi:hypothetical protein
MPLPELGASEILSIITHLKKWVINLLRAKAKRKQQSKKALRAVIKAVRETTIYLRIIRDTGKKSIKKERELSLLWTDLSFKLEDIKLKKLAENCMKLSRYWAEPSDFDESFLEKAGNRLSDIEQLAQASLDLIK